MRASFPRIGTQSISSFWRIISNFWMKKELQLPLLLEVDSVTSTEELWVLDSQCIIDSTEEEGQHRLQQGLHQTSQLCKLPSLWLKQPLFLLQCRTKLGIRTKPRIQLPIARSSTSTWSLWSRRIRKQRGTSSENSSKSSAATPLTGVIKKVRRDWSRSWSGLSKSTKTRTWTRNTRPSLTWLSLKHSNQFYIIMIGFNSSLL